MEVGWTVGSEVGRALGCTVGWKVGLWVGDWLGLEEGLAVGCGVGFPGKILSTGVGLLEGVDGVTVGRDEVGMALVGCMLEMEDVGLDEEG